MKSFPLERDPAFTPEYRKLLLKRTALPEDTARVITEPGVYTDNGRPVIIYGVLGARYDRMLWAVRSIKYHEGERTLGLRSTSRVFGFRPRLTIRRDYCAPASLAEHFPEQHRVICEFGQLLAAIYREFAPEVYERHCQSIARVRSEWLIPGTPFTSGIVNWDNPLKYHHDAGNFKGLMSCMVVFRREIEGGELSIPEYGVRFALPDHAFFLFDGAAILHGVTNIKRQTARAYRYSAVYYALQQMQHCLSCEEELKRIRVVKREREKRRLEYQPPPAPPEGGQEQAASGGSQSSVRGTGPGGSAL